MSDRVTFTAGDLETHMPRVDATSFTTAAPGLTKKALGGLLEPSGQYPLLKIKIRKSRRLTSNEDSVDSNDGSADKG